VDQRSHKLGRKVAIVTAAGTGMGTACARELATRAYSLALMSRSDGRLIYSTSPTKSDTPDSTSYSST
jgi:NADP-dependent 3-hydroxy acid dehydrogenase YdfG